MRVRGSWLWLVLHHCVRDILRSSRELRGLREKIREDLVYRCSYVRKPQRSLHDVRMRCVSSCRVGKSLSHISQAHAKNAEAADEVSRARHELRVATTGDISNSFTRRRVILGCPKDITH